MGTSDEENLTPDEKAARLMSLRPSQDRATLHDSRIIAKQLAQESVEPVKKGLKLNAIITAAGGLVVLIASVGTGVLATQNIARDAAAQTVIKEVTPVKSDVAAQKERHEFFKEEFKRHLNEEAEHHKTVLRQQYQMDQKMDVVLDAMRVPMAKRPARAPDSGPE